MRSIRWNPNLTDEDRAASRNREMAVPEVRFWRMAVYKRDGYVCQACGSGKSGTLVAHHKESWNSNKELRLVVENGDTACEPCHKEFHSLYGWGNNTKEQWDEFVSSQHMTRAIV